jgi:hypothetical protein
MLILIRLKNILLFMAIRLPGSEEVDSAVDEVVMALSSSDKVDAVGFTGSVAFGLLDEHSDVDMICIVSSYMSVKERRELLGMRDYSPLADTVYQETFTVDGVEIDIQFRERKWFLDVLSNKEMASDFNEKYVLYMLQNVVPMFDNGGILKSMMEKAAYTDTFAIRRIESSYQVLAKTKDMADVLSGRGDVTFLDRTFLDAMEKYVSVIFALNRRYYSDVKWGLQKIAKMDVKPAGWERDLSELSGIGNDADGVRRKTSLLKSMLLALSAVIRERMPSADISLSDKAIQAW